VTTLHRRPALSRILNEMVGYKVLQR
jgi:hypothetical protein